MSLYCPSFSFEFHDDSANTDISEDQPWRASVFEGFFRTKGFHDSLLGHLWQIIIVRTIARSSCVILTLVCERMSLEGDLLSNHVASLDEM